MCHTARLFTTAAITVNGNGWDVAPANGNRNTNGWDVAPGQSFATIS
ncbi:hypothetical protein ACWDYJ_30045 [Streptomyces sp. NPDC003042]